MNGPTGATLLVPDDPAPPVVAALPTGAAHGVAEPPGDADYLLLCDDGVTIDLTDVQALLDVARSTGAGVVGPKLVDADDPYRLVAMGYAVTRGGAVAPLVEPGERDQGQHDGTRDVFAVPATCALVRADVLRSVGFDPALPAGSPALAVSLCWRARVAGAGVLVTSDAVAAVDRTAAVRSVSGRERLRLVLSCYGRAHRWRVVPQVAAAQVVGSVGDLGRARPGAAVEPWTAWAANLWRWRSLRAVRRQVRRSRRTPDRTVRRRQVPGVDHPRVAARRELPGGTTASVPRPVAAWAHRLRSRWTNEGAFVMLALVGVLALGSRHLVTRGVPEVGDLLPLGADSGLLRLVLTVGLVPLGVAGAVVAARASGSTRAPVAAAVAYAALPMPYAALAAGRWAPLAVYAAAPWWLAQLTPRAAASGAVTSGAETSGAVTSRSAAMPGAVTSGAETSGAVTSRSAATSGAAVPGPVTPVPSAPLPASTGSTGGDGGGPRHLGRPDRARRGDALRRVVVLGAITAVLAAVVPAAPVLLAGTGLALGLGSLLAFRGRQVLAPVATALGGALLAVALHLPWAVDPASAAAPWSAFRRLAEADAPVHAVEPVDLLAFGVGHPGVLPWLWALPLAAAIPLLVGRGDRLAGAIRGWTLALVAWPVALAAARVGAAAPLPDVDVLLVLAGAGIASAVGLGVAAVEADVAPPRRRRVLRRDRRRWRPPSQARRLGWRSATTGVVVVAVALAALPLLRSSLDGYWGMPRGDFGGVLGFVDDEVAASGGRILWLGDERVVPLRQDAPARRADLGRGMGPRPAADAADAAVPAGDDGTAALAVTDRLPRLPDRWRPVPAAVLTSARESVEAGTAEATHRLGEALAPLGVEYVVVPQGLAPAPFGPPEAPAPAVVGALDGQFDLERVEVDPSVVVYRNLAFRTGPALGAVPDPPGQPPQTPQTFPDAASRRTPAPGQQLLDGPPPEPSPWKLRLGLTAWGAILLFILVLQRRRADEGPEVL